MQVNNFDSNNIGVVYGIWNTYPSSPQHQKQLDLVENYYHAPSGLHNEGVWHNCVMMINYYLLLTDAEHELATESRQYLYRALCKVSHSLLELNYDPGSKLFRQRTETEYWSHENAKNNMHLLQLYHRTEHKDQVYKLVSNAVALLAYSLISDANDKFTELSESESMRVASLDVTQLLEQIQSLFFKPDFNAYSTKVKLPLTNSQDYHFKAVDHAVLLLAIAVMDSKSITPPDRFNYGALQVQLRKSLIDLFEFRKGGKVRSYVEHLTMEDKHKEHHRYLWQDVWVLLALLVSSDDPAKDENLQSSIDDIFNIYENLDGVGLFCEPKPSTYDIQQLATRRIDLEGHGERTVFVSPQTNFFFNCYTGDNSLLNGLLLAMESYGCEWVSDKPAVTQFMKSGFPTFIQQQIQRNKSDELYMGKYETLQLNISDNMPKPALWANSEYLLSRTFVRGLKQILSRSR